ncbi:MAG: MFS transporter, partial [Actinomycetota bacterium]|nr:MFS transporter [Actinomycetota bacterium]
ARQLGAAVGIAVAGGLLGSVLSSEGDARPSDLEGALTPGWIIVIASGVALVLLAVLTRESTRPASPRKSG